jgi:penicillin amidase
LARALPMLAGFLDMPTVTVPGAHDDMPRIQGVDFGASERFSVSPGHESEGYFHMPGGQSGHPLSPFYRAGFDAWATGSPTPFLPGPQAHELRLTP